MKAKTARRILKKRSWEISEWKTHGRHDKPWLGRLEAKCADIVKKDMKEKEDQKKERKGVRKAIKTWLLKEEE